MNQHPQELLEDLRRVLTTTLDAPVQLVPGTMSPNGWRVGVTAAGALLTLTFDGDGVAALARALTAPGAAAPASPAQVVHDLVANAIGATASGDPDNDVQVHDAEFVEWMPMQGVTVAGFTCEALPAPLAVSIGREVAGAAASRAAARQGAVPAAGAGRFGVLMDIDVPLVVRFGCTDMSLKALSRLGPGSLIDLSRAPEDPVEVLVGGRVVARGQVVVVSGSYGIRIVDVAEGRSQAVGMEA